MFKYFVCLDFEATCWPGYYTNKENSEIIEIGAVLLNLSSGTIEDKFHHYVRPTRCPELSDFCVNLTGITQKLVDGQEAFPDVYRKFDDWIKRIQYERNIKFASPVERHANINGINATFCSWSNFDLDFYFKKECQRAGIAIPPYFKAWIDIRPHFDQKYPGGRCTFSDALKRAKSDVVGSAHSGIDDATNLAKLVTNIIYRGGQLNKINS